MSSLPTAESFAFIYHEFKRESMLVWEIDCVLTCQGLETQHSVSSFLGDNFLRVGCPV